MYLYLIIFCLAYQGTGKSVTGAHLAYAFYCKNKSIDKVTSDKMMKCVLVCGPSNKSVDVVLGRLQLMQLRRYICRLICTGAQNMYLHRVHKYKVSSKPLMIIIAKMYGCWLL